MRRLRWQQWESGQLGPAPRPGTALRAGPVRGLRAAAPLCPQRAAPRGR